MNVGFIKVVYNQLTDCKTKLCKSSLLFKWPVLYSYYDANICCFYCNLIEDIKITPRGLFFPLLAHLKIHLLS